MEIVPIAEEHIEGFHQCLDSVARERLYLAFLEAPSIEDTRGFVLSNIAHDVPQFVAVETPEVVGWCDISPAIRPGWTHCGRLGMGVLKGYRGMGIGRGLLMAALDKARARGLERIELEVFASNQAAIALYKSAGFVIEGIKKRGRKLEGIYDDVVCMALLYE